MMAFHYTLKSFSLADADHVHKFLAVENIHKHAVASLYCSISLRFFVDLYRNFAHELDRGQIILRQVPTHRLRKTRFLYEFNQSDLRGVVSVLGLRLVLSNYTRPRL